MVQLKGQTNLFRTYPQIPPFGQNQGFIYCEFARPIKTADGGYLFSAYPWSPNIHAPNPVAYYTIKTNSQFVPNWMKYHHTKSLSLPTGGVISINCGRAIKGSIISKQTLSGQVLWSKELLAVPSTTSAYYASDSVNVLCDGIAYNNKFRIVAYFEGRDYSGATVAFKNYTAEFDTTNGNLISANELVASGVNTNSFSVNPTFFTNIFRDPSGNFYFSGGSKEGLAKFSSSFTFMWNLAWPNSVFLPKIVDLKFTQNLDIMCSMQYYDTLSANNVAGIMRVTNPAIVVFEKITHSPIQFKGVDNMPSNNFIFSFIKNMFVSDSSKAGCLSSDGNGNLVWSKIYHKSMQISPPLALGNGEYICNYITAPSQTIAQNPGVFSINQNGNTSCSSQTLAIAFNSISSTPTLNAVSLQTIAVRLLNSSPMGNGLQNSRDTCGGVSPVSALFENKNSTFEDLSISPNPSNGKIKINKLKANQAIIVEVYNFAGQLCTKTSVSGTNVVDFEFLARGIYYVYFYDLEKLLTIKKLIISSE